MASTAVGPAMASMAPSSAGGGPGLAKPVQGGRFDFDDGGMYCGGWEDGKAHGHGVCTGLKGQGEYSGSWNYGFEVSGVYTWPGGSTYEGHWQNGKRHGLGVESRGRWIYRGEWTQGFKGRYGVRQSLTSAAKYDGTWANGLQDGYGSETYADGGTYQGQWLRGLRHGYGVRTSAPFGMASRFRPKSNNSNVRSSTTSLKSDAAASSAIVSSGGHHGHHHQSGSSSGGGGGGGGGGGNGGHQLHSGGSLDPAADRDKRLDDGRGGFVLKARSDEPPVRRRSFSERSSTIKKSLFQGLRLKKQHSTGELEKRGTSASIRSTGSSASWMSTESSQSGMTAGAGSHHTDSNASFIAEDEPLDASVTETYMGEWKNDKRAGFGISERSDGLKYEGEWFNNKKYGYGVTTLKDGTKEEGKYKNNVLITSQKKKHLFLIRSAKFRERIEAAVSAAQRASKIALQKADIAISRTSTARTKAELADVAAVHAREDADFAVVIAKQLAPDFQPSSETMRPPLAALSRLATQPPAVTAASLQANNKSIQYLTANNVQQHDQYGYADGGGLAATAAARVEEYTSSGGGTELTRRPSVAIGGVRSPNMNVPSGIAIPSAAAKMTNTTNTTDPDAIMMMMANNLPYSPSSSSRPNSVQHMSSSSSMYAAPSSNYSMSNNGPMPMVRKGSLMAQQQQQQQHPFPYPQQQQQSYSGSYQMESSQQMYSPSMDDIMQMQMQMQNPAVGQMERGRSSLRRGPTLTGGSFSGGGGGGGGGYQMEQSSHHAVSGGGGVGVNPSYNFQQAMNDHFDHYKRPPSRDRSRDPSMDRFSRSSRQSSVAALSRQESALMGVGSRGPSPAPTPAAVGRSVSRHRPPSSLAGTASPGPGNRHSDVSMNPSSLNDHSLQRRMATPVRETSHHHSTSPGNGSIPGFSGHQQPTNSIEEMLLRQRLGQEIPHQSGGSGPKRTESLYISPARKQEKAVAATSPKRKKSLPGADDPPVLVLSREEASALSSQRREEMRRQVEEAERYRANPFLYFCSPQVKGWFARQQLIIFILFINISLAFLFFKLLT